MRYPGSTSVAGVRDEHLARRPRCGYDGWPEGRAEEFIVRCWSVLLQESGESGRQVGYRLRLGFVPDEEADLRGGVLEQAHVIEEQNVLLECVRDLRITAST